MKVIEHLQKRDRPVISFEVLPPERGGKLEKLIEVIGELMKHKPSFIDVTSHPAQIVYEERIGIIERRIRRKRPGTLGVCTVIKERYHVDTVPHILCNGFTRDETEDLLIDANFVGIDNVLAIKGDDSDTKRELVEGQTKNDHAIDLVKQVKSMNDGVYLDGLPKSEHTSFCVGVAGYPEKHFEAPNIKTDIERLKEKVEAGADYIVTQMFFDNAKYFEFVKKCSDAGIKVPIIPGLKVLTSYEQLRSVASRFHADIPYELSEEITKSEKEHRLEIGVEWAYKQVRGLLDGGAPSVHFYVINNTTAIHNLMKKLLI